MAHRNSPESLLLRKKELNKRRLGIEISLGLPERLSEPEMTPSPAAPDEKTTFFLGFYYQGDVEALNGCANHRLLLK